MVAGYQRTKEKSKTAKMGTVGAQQIIGKSPYLKEAKEKSDAELKKMFTFARKSEQVNYY